MLTVEEQIKLIADAAMGALDLDTAAEQRATPRETVLDLPVADTSSPVQFTEEVVTMIDVKTTDPTETRQKGPMHVVVAGILAAAAAVIAIAFVVTRDTDPVTPADEPSTIVTVPATPFPRAQDNGGHSLRYVPGTYFVDEVSGTPTPRISFTIGAGWRDMTPGLEILQGDIGGIAFSRADRVFSDACHWSSTPTPTPGSPPPWAPNGSYYPGPVATLDDVAAALSQQGGWVDVTAPSDISIDGYAGKAFQRTAPADLSDCSTRPPNFSPYGNAATYPQLPVLRSWQNDSPRIEDSGGEYYEPGEVETLWILDIDGTVIIINTRLWPSATTGARLSPEARALAGPSAAARADSAAVLDSIRIDRG